MATVLSSDMDYKFPSQLFPHFYLNGLPDQKAKHDYAGWGSYGLLLEKNTEEMQCGEERGPQWEFQTQRVPDGEVWVPTEPMVTPLLPPNDAGKMSSGPPFSPQNFPEHMQYFYTNHCMDAFSTMGQLFAEHISFSKKRKEKLCKMGTMKKFIDGLNYKKCELGHYSRRVSRYHNLLEDVVTDIPPVLLAELLHEELALQRDLEQFQPATTGGALGYIPIPESPDWREACLIYPRGEALNSLHFHRVVLECGKRKPPTLNLNNEPVVFNLNGTVRQVSAAAVTEEAHIGVRSDHFCAAWLMTDIQRPQIAEVIKLKERSTCLNVSPHIPGELVVTSESGAAYLWTVKKGLQKFREEDSNLYFNANSSWRWCEFSAHPRIMVFADRTGAELTDSRSNDCSHTLFRIGRTAHCLSGERVILAKYLGQSHAHHHLITTQFSAYVLDERMPGIPALKWEHMMESPPCFAQVLPAVGQHGTSKILLGAQRAQETVLLQYSGGREQPCQSHGSVQKLLSPCESLKLRQLPHRQHKAQKRLAVPTAGLHAIQVNSFLSVFHLTEAGDIFYQTLKQHSGSTTSNPDPSATLRSDPVEPAAAASVSSSQTAPISRGIVDPTNTQPRETSTASDEDEFSDSDFERERHQRLLSQVEVVINDVDDHPYSSSSDEEHSHEQNLGGSSVPSTCVTNTRPVRPASPETASRELKQIWKKWLESLLTTTKKRRLKHKQIKTKHIMQFKVQQRDELEKDKFQSLRKELTKTMKSGKVLVHGNTYLPAFEPPQFPDTVKPVDWQDDLSQRLTASWGNNWKEWWEEKLGMNRDAKIEALRRKRRREKQARSRNRVALSESFTSSISYQDDLSDWSSATSQYLGSDSESFVNSQSALEDHEVSDAENPSKSPVVQGVSPNGMQLSSVLEVVKSSLRSKRTIEVCEEADAVPATQSPLPPSSPTKKCPLQPDHGSTVETDRSISASASLQTPKRRQQWDLNSLFTSQEPSQDPDYDGGDSLTIPSMSFNSGFSFASRPQFQRKTSTQTSQSQRKKSRMGF